MLLFKKNVYKFIFIWLKGKITIDIHQKYKNILAFGNGMVSNRRTVQCIITPVHFMILHPPFFVAVGLSTLGIVFCQIEIVLKDSTVFVSVTKSVWSSVVYVKWLN